MKTKILKLSRRFLPRIFLKKVYFGGHVLHWPRWGFTKKEIADAEKSAKELNDSINWE